MDCIFHLFFRHGITFKEVFGESEKVAKEMTAPWEETTLTTILARYQLKDIFNADEFDLFYKALPSKPLHFWGKHCSGGKHSKVRLKGMAVSNALGEKILEVLEVSDLKTINLQFLPPNTTSCTQPMDHGVIRYVCFIIFLFY